ncbi:MAG: PadR family transcriptional regulator [archaeon]|nr:PadR family transcriptional regulator [archaeon]
MPVSGIDISDQINFYTNNEWKPSPGSIYFILNELLSKGMISEVISPDTNVKRYITTDKGMAMLSLFFKVADQALKRQFIFAGIMAQVAEKDLAKIFVELAELILTSDKEKEKKLKLMINQLILKVKEL